MTNDKKTVLILSLIGIGAMFLPWIYISNHASYTGVLTGGITTTCLFLLISFISLIDLDKKKPYGVTSAVIIGSLSCHISTYCVSKLTAFSAKEVETAYGFIESVGPGFGIIVVFLASIFIPFSMVVFSLANELTNKNE